MHTTQSKAILHSRYKSVMHSDMNKGGAIVNTHCPAPSIEYVLLRIHEI